MPFRRRVALATLAVPALLLRRTALAQEAAWPPGRPIRIVVPFAAAGSSDAVARYLAERLARLLGQPVVVENRAGAGGTVGAAEVARATPDGTSFLIVTTNHAINETLQPKRGYQMLRDLTPVAMINALPLALAVANAVPAKTVAELIAHAKAHPGKLDYATSGPGSLYHLFTEEFCRRTGIEMQHIPFRNFNEGRAALIAGQVQVMFDAGFTLAPLITASQVRGLATTGSAPLALLPTLPLLSATVPGMEVSLWNGLVGPADLPARVTEGMNAAVNRVLAEPEVVEAQAKLGAVLSPMSAAAFGTFLQNEIASQAAAVQRVGIRLD